mmetsp:Transcript_36558/g.57131  ORF Transcript_36558/g.57131 Transcript_36558/m.57131 type:complete len:86 (-) Transcript_36558:33-290(-)
MQIQATSSRQLTGSACCLQQPEEGFLAHCLKCFSIVEGRCLIDLQVLPTAHVPRTPEAPAGYFFRVFVVAIMFVQQLSFIISLAL